MGEFTSKMNNPVASPPREMKGHPDIDHRVPVPEIARMRRGREISARAASFPSPAAAAHRRESSKVYRVTCASKASIRPRLAQRLFHNGPRPGFAVEW